MTSVLNIRIAVAGLSNVGKTTFINQVTGANLKTANFSGSTTNIKEISVKQNINGEKIIFTFFDIPGLDSLTNLKNDLEKEAAHFIKEEKYDILLHIANADFLYFSKLLDHDLKENIKKPIITAVNFPSSVKNIEEMFNKFNINALFSALSTESSYKLLSLIQSGEVWEKQNFLPALSKVRFNRSKFTHNLDKIALSKVFGLPLFFGVMFIIFWLSFVIGKGVGDFLAEGFNFAIQIINNLAFLNNFLKALTQSVLTGIGIVIGFMPVIIVCSILLNMLEQTGYITRVCFLLDKFFNKFHLGGKSLIPLIIGAGCSISAYMSARMISDPKEKFLTMIIIGFIPCSAKLAVFLLFCAALFGKMAPFAIFIIYLSGFLIGLFVAKILGIFYKEEFRSTRIELFHYHFPPMKNVLKTGFTRTADFVKNASTFIAIFAAILSLSTLIGFQGGHIIQTSNIEESLIAIISKSVSPLFAPLNLDWKMITSLLTAIVAKEVAISTLAVLYSSDQAGLLNVIPAQIGLREALTYLTFMFFYLPCISATASFHREIGSWKKTFFLITFTTFLAYISSMFVNYVLTMLLL